MLNVHMIGNAHLDPVWLWRWPAGVAEVLATCRTACDMLDDFPTLVFTRSDAWVYERIEDLDLSLFQRIKNHIAGGRWAVVGGWYIQPDCNFPRPESFEKHFEVGGRYCVEKLGVTVTVGYNVDSFGHAGSLPGMLAAHGYDSYVMMRPMAHEKTLPASLFRWRANSDARLPGEVLAYRIPVAYCTAEADLCAHVEKVIATATPGVDHLMCFYGVGDHGGGPTREQVRWIIKNAEAFPGARLIFSHPRAFFDAVKPFREKLPVIEGELQHHSVGCYSVVRSIKTSLRRAEHALLMAEKTVATFPAEAPAEAAHRLGRAWKTTLFNQFHDIYGGTSIRAACEDAVAQLGGARSEAESVAYETLFRRAASFSPSPQQRVAVFNASDSRFDGYIHWEPWFNENRFDGWLADESDAPIAHQVLPSHSQAGLWGSLLWPASLAPGEMRFFSLHAGAGASPPDTDLSCDEHGIENEFWTIGRGSDDELLTLRARGRTAAGAMRVGIAALDDKSDTWSHRLDRFAGSPRGQFLAGVPVLEEAGPVRASLRVPARFGASSVTLHARLYRGDPRVELELRLDWHESLTISKLLVNMEHPVTDRLDGITGGAHARPNDGKECTLIDWTIAHLANGATVGIACPDCSAIDGSGALLRPTLVRSPAFAWHDPAPFSEARARFTDQGEHIFRFTLLAGAEAGAIERLALAAHRPPLCFDWTKGMT
jgi:alpha-mannosidase